MSDKQREIDNIAEPVFEIPKVPDDGAINFREQLVLIFEHLSRLDHRLAYVEERIKDTLRIEHLRPIGLIKKGKWIFKHHYLRIEIHGTVYDVRM